MLSSAAEPVQEEEEEEEEEAAAAAAMLTPPARVDSMKMNESELGAEKRSIAFCRSVPG